MNAILVPLLCLNLSVPNDVYVDIDMEIEAEQAIQADLKRRSNIRLNGEPSESTNKSRIQINNRGMRHSRTNVSFGFPI